jgi:hypothetical protein
MLLQVPNLASAAQVQDSCQIAMDGIVHNDFYIKETVFTLTITLRILLITAKGSHHVD